MSLFGGLFGLGGALLMWALLRSRTPEAAREGDGYALRYPWGWRALAWFLPGFFALMSFGASVEAQNHNREPPVALFLLSVLGASAFALFFDRKLYGSFVRFDRVAVERRRGSEVVARVKWSELIELQCDGDTDARDIVLRDRAGTVLKISTAVSGLTTFSRHALEHVRPRAIDATTWDFLELHASKEIPSLPTWDGPARDELDADAELMARRKRKPPRVARHRSNLTMWLVIASAVFVVAGIAIATNDLARARRATIVEDASAPEQPDEQVEAVAPIRPAAAAPVATEAPPPMATARPDAPVATPANGEPCKLDPATVYGVHGNMVQELVGNERVTVCESTAIVSAALLVVRPSDGAVLYVDEGVGSRRLVRRALMFAAPSAKVAPPPDPVVVKANCPSRDERGNRDWTRDALRGLFVNPESSEVAYQCPSGELHDAAGRDIPLPALPSEGAIDVLALGRNGAILVRVRRGNAVRGNLAVVDRRRAMHDVANVALGEGTPFARAAPKGGFYVRVVPIDREELWTIDETHAATRAAVVPAAPNGTRGVLDGSGGVAAIETKWMRQEAPTVLFSRLITGR